MVIKKYNYTDKIKLLVDHLNVSAIKGNMKEVLNTAKEIRLLIIKGKIELLKLKPDKDEFVKLVEEIKNLTLK